MQMGAENAADAIRTISTARSVRNVVVRGNAKTQHTTRVPATIMVSTIL